MHLRLAWRWPAILASSLLLSALGSAAYGRTPLELHLEVATKPTAVSPPTTSSAAMLVLNAMPENRRRLLAESLAKLGAVVDRKKNPLFVSLDDSEERAAVEDLVAQTAPLFTAATSLAAGSWPSPEGDVQVLPVAHCAPARPCVRLADPAGSDEQSRRARFLAWPLGYAVFLAVSDRAKLDEVALTLRAPGSFQIGLVLTSAELHELRASPALVALQKNARRLLKSMPDTRTPLATTLASLVRAGRSRRELPWLQLPSDTILVVPRLSALATADKLVADVRNRLASVDTQVEWLASPH
jgi:hypothetical protein